jgi:hypothetical protein
MVPPGVLSVQRRAAKSLHTARLVESAAAVALGACAIWAARIAVITSLRVQDPSTGHTVALSFHKWTEIACGAVAVLAVELAIWVRQHC